MSDITFSRLLLKAVHAEVKQHFPNINLWKDAWVYHFLRDHWEFHGPNKFYWHGSADNAYHARALGWSSYLSRVGKVDDLNRQAEPTGG